MLGQDNQVLDIDYTIAPGKRADVTQWIIRVPVVHHDAHISSIDNSITIEVNDRDDRLEIRRLAEREIGVRTSTDKHYAQDKRH